MPRITETVTKGIRSLEKSARRPKHFSDAALVKLRDLALLRSPEIPNVSVGNGTGEPVALSQKLVTNVEKLLGEEIESIGTVEGELEGLIIHGKRRFYLFDHLTGRQITCYFTPRVEWESVLKAFGKRVAVTGTIKSRSSGEKVSVSAFRFYVFPAEEDLPGPEDVMGALSRPRK
jgi:hypothetical protein